jgi:hypothetical protein
MNYSGLDTDSTLYINQDPASEPILPERLAQYSALTYRAAAKNYFSKLS